MTMHLRGFHYGVFFLLLLLSFCGYGQDLSEADSFFAKSPLAIRNEINGKPILNDFPLYNRVVKDNSINYLPEVYRENITTEKEFDLLGTTFSGNFFLNTVNFKETVDLTQCNFLSPFKLVTVTFSRNVPFNWTHFSKDVIFSRVTFQSGGQFMRAAFDTSATFRLCRFDELIFFYSSVFNGPASFNDSRFLKGAGFNLVEFHEPAKFNRAEFHETVNFNNVQFHKGADFTQVTFDKLADFSNVSTKGTLEFRGASLPEYLDLSGIIEIDGTINLLESRANRDVEVCNINLVNSDISKFNLEYDHFKLYFPKEVSFDEKVSTYEELLKNFKENGLEESYEKLDIEFSQFKYAQKKQSAANLAQKIWWNYGYDKNMIFVWIFRILLFFTAINTLFIRKLITGITEMPFLSRQTVEKHNLHHPIIAYFLNFPGTFLYTFILIVSGSTGLSIIKDHSKIPNVVWMIYMIVLSLIGLSLSIFIFNYIIN